MTTTASLPALVRVEVSRLLHRRAVQLLLIAVVAVPVVLGLATMVHTRPVSGAELRHAQQQVAKDASSRALQREIARCRQHPGEYGVDPGLDTQARAAACDRNLMPRVEFYTSRPQLDLLNEQQDSGMGVAALVTLLLLLVGATYAGHDWATGSMGNQLLFEPRRGRTWAAKALAVSGVCGLFALAVNTVYWLALGALAHARDVPPPHDVLLDCLQQGWRTAALATVVALVGYGLTMLLRSTVGSLGVLLAVVVGGGIVVGIFGLNGAWFPSTIFEAIVRNTATYWDEANDTQHVVHLGRATFVAAVPTLLVLALSLASFRRRDVP